MVIGCSGTKSEQCVKGECAEIDLIAGNAICSATFFEPNSIYLLIPSNAVASRTRAEFDRGWRNAARLSVRNIPMMINASYRNKHRLKTISRIFRRNKQQSIRCAEYL
jgi:hypothetical protein